MSDERGELESGELESGELESGPSRRAWLAGAGAIGATAFLAACGSDDTGGAGTPPGGPAGDGSEPGSGGTDGGDQEPLTSADEVEVGGGVILASETVVVTQPTAGTFKGFSAACTHEGCIVSSINDGIIFCSCHGSQYSIEDGSVVQAAPGLTPQTQNPLPPIEVREEGGSIVRA